MRLNIHLHWWWVNKKPRLGNRREPSAPGGDVLVQCADPGYRLQVTHKGDPHFCHHISQFCFDWLLILTPIYRQWEQFDLFNSAFFRSARTFCTTFDWSVRPCALKIWITFMQAYMPYESSEDSSNQPYGPIGSPRCPLDILGPLQPSKLP